MYQYAYAQRGVTIFEGERLRKYEYKIARPFIKFKGIT